MTSTYSDFCAIHPERKSRSACDYCGKAYCAECEVEDIATDTGYCSQECRSSKLQDPVALQRDREFVANFATPIRSGWSLWLRSIPKLLMYLLPVAVICGVAISWSQEEHAWIVAVAFGFGIALTQVVLSREYVGLAEGNPLVWTARRFLFWLCAIGLVFTASMIGFVALVLPGMYLSLRLFWADEFALIHHSNPIEALRESWRLTENEVGAIFVFQFLVGLSSYLLVIVAVIPSLLLASIADFLTGPIGEIVRLSLTICVFLVIYGGIHAPEVIYFYGMRAQRSSGLAESTKTLGLS